MVSVVCWEVVVFTTIASENLSDVAQEEIEFIIYAVMYSSFIEVIHVRSFHPNELAILQ